MFSGVKTASYTLGFDSHIVLNDPASMKTATPVTTVLDWAQEAGMATGRGGYQRSGYSMISGYFARRHTMGELLCDLNGHIGSRGIIGRLGKY